MLNSLKIIPVYYSKNVYKIKNKAVDDELKDAAFSLQQKCKQSFSFR